MWTERSPLPGEPTAFSMVFPGREITLLFVLFVVCISTRVSMLAFRSSVLAFLPAVGGLPTLTRNANVLIWNADMLICCWTAGVYFSIYCWVCISNAVKIKYCICNIATGEIKQHCFVHWRKWLCNLLTCYRMCTVCFYC